MTARTAHIRMRVAPQLKAESEAILHDLGLSMSDAINLFLNQVKHNRGIPFAIKLPNEETMQAIEELESGQGHKAQNVQQMFDDILS